MMSHSIFLFMLPQLRGGRFPSEQLHPVCIYCLICPAPILPTFTLSHSPHSTLSHSPSLRLPNSWPYFTADKLGHPTTPSTGIPPETRSQQCFSHSSGPPCRISGFPDPDLLMREGQTVPYFNKWHLQIVLDPWEHAHSWTTHSTYLCSSWVSWHGES